MTPDDRPLRWWEQTHGVPRRFGVGALLAVTVVYALCFSLASATSRRVGEPRRAGDAAVPPAIVSVLFVWLTTVGVSQALLFGGRRPRLASLLTGAMLMLCAVVAFAVWQWFRGALLGTNLRDVVVLMGIATPVGALLGYLTGGLVAGVFVILAGLKRR